MSYKPLTYIYQAAGPPTAPTLLLLHGTGGDERDLLPLAPRLAPGFNVLSVRGNVLEGRMPRFFARLGVGVFDEKDLVFRTHELAHFLREISQTEKFDVQRIVVVGYSNGANIAGGLLLLHPELLAGAVLWRPMQPLTNDVPPAPAPASAPVLLMPGAHDPTVQPSATNQYAALLTNRGFQLSRHDVPAGHDLTQTDVETATAWLQREFPAAVASQSN
ncbi:alpha/beta hydrolase [uncultured Hymenobacter sp.]|uniref:alpha/beta hydrolase n=1 Tax=uncultured Hymenobacter sp. TaxID=170016 RepID=UPI0035CC5BAD